MLEPLESGKLHIGDAREDYTEARIISLRRYIAMNKAIVERNGSARPERSPLAFISTGARNALTARCSLFVCIDLPTESRLNVLMRDLEPATQIMFLQQMAQISGRCAPSIPTPNSPDGSTASNPATS
jgi:hypothetical protein